MKTLLLCLAAILTAWLTTRAAEPENPLTMRQRFVPTKRAEGERNRASWSALWKAPMVDEGELFMQGRAGIGDNFPVADKSGKKLFEVAVTGGDDDHLLVEVRAEGGTQKFDLVRDKRVPMEVGGAKFTLLYPSLTVNRADNAPTTDLAHIFVTKLK